VHVPHCTGQLALLTLPLILLREKGKLIFLLPRSAAIYRECGAGSDIFSVHAGTCTVNTWALYVLYDLYDLTPYTYSHMANFLSVSVFTPGLRETWKICTLKLVCIKTIDMSRLSRPPHTFFLCAGFVQFVLVVSAALLCSKNCGEGGQLVFQTFSTII
jgi:hypothetical protein